MAYLSGQSFSQTASVTVANTVTKTTLVGAGIGSKIIAANTPQIGKTYQVIIMGVHSATGAPNITIDAALGSTAIGSTGAVATGSSTNAYFEIRLFFTYRTLGASGTLFAQGFYYEVGGGATLNSYPMTNTSTITIDTTVDQALDVSVTWGTASASNTITATNFILRTLN